MEKNSTLILMIILIGICWFGIFKFSGLAALNLEEPFAYAGREIILEKVYPNAVVISVDGEKDFFELGDTKLINGVEIHLSKITYFPEKEDQSAEINLASTTVCSDGKCELGEDSDNCCIDCGCPGDYECENNECVYRPPDECETDADCDDLNMSTKDLCFGEPKTCHYQVILCHLDKDCDDNDPCTEDRCSFNDCVHEPIEGCGIFTRPKDIQEEKQETFFEKLLRKLFNLF